MIFVIIVDFLYRQPVIIMMFKKCKKRTCLLHHLNWGE